MTYEGFFLRARNADIVIRLSAKRFETERQAKKKGTNWAMIQKPAHIGIENPKPTSTNCTRARKQEGSAGLDPKQRLLKREMQEKLTLRDNYLQLITCPLTEVAKQKSR
jgi:hypothetical protein